MLKQYKKTKLAVSMLCAGLPLLAAASDFVVAPPTPPAGVKPVTSEIIAPVQVSDIKAGDTLAVSPSNANAAQPALADLLPPPIPPQAAKQVAPGPQKETVKKAKVVKPKQAADAFASLVTHPVSDSQLNQFVFPEKVEGIYFPEGAPLATCSDDAQPNDPCKPIFLNNRHMMLLQLKAGAKGPVQMLVHLHSGRMLTLNLSPGHGPGAVIRVDGAEDGISDARRASQGYLPSAASEPVMAEETVKFISEFAEGKIPVGFDSVEVGSPTKFSHFEVVPMAAWSNGSGLKAHLMQVRAFDENPVAITPGIFRAKNVKGVSLDKTTITNKAPAMLYMIEATKE